MNASWNLAELDAECAASTQRQDQERARMLELLPPVSYGLPITPRRRRRVAELPVDDAALFQPARMSAAWLTEVRKLRTAGVITRAEARAYLGLPPKRWWRFGR